MKTYQFFACCVAICIAGSACKSSPQVSDTIFSKTVAEAFEEWRAAVVSTRTGDPKFEQVTIEAVDDAKGRLLANDAVGFSTRFSEVMGLVLQPEFSLAREQRKYVWDTGTKFFNAADEMRKKQGGGINKEPMKNTECKKGNSCTSCQCGSTQIKGQTCTTTCAGLGICTCPSDCKVTDPSFDPFDPPRIPQ